MTSSTPAGQQLDTDTTDALQDALAAEHAAVWMYGLASAFLSSTYSAERAAGVTAHQATRDTIERTLTAAGAAPRPADPAYATPKPVSNQNSMINALVVAESDVTKALRVVLENTDNGSVRRAALDALTAAAVRGTRWRAHAGLSPAEIPMPGT